MITQTKFAAHLKCPLKAYLLDAAKLEPRVHPYVAHEAEQSDGYRKAAIKNYTQSVETSNSAKTQSLMIDGRKFINGSQFTDREAQCSVDCLEKVRGRSDLGMHHYIPVIACRASPTLDDKILLGYMAMQVAKTQNRAPQFGKIISGPEFKVQVVRLSKFISKASILVEMLSTIDAEPKLRLNAHCKICEFKDSCFERARQKDDLSLLSRISAKEVDGLNKRGIFTIEHLSQKFRPQKKHKDIGKNKKPRSHSLHALAIQTGKVHVYNCPPIPAAETEVFLDVECDPGRDFFYLVGGVICNSTKEKIFQFWADDEIEGEHIFRKLLSQLDTLGPFKLFHFGSFESRYIKTMAKRLEMESDPMVRRMLDSSVNVLEFLYSSIYFPTYSNDLKSIGAFLGFKWSRPESSGLQSIVWRSQWEHSRDDKLKKTLLTYNQEDYFALRRVSKFVQRVGGINFNEPDQASESVVNASALAKQSAIRWGPVNFAMTEMQEINDCAYYSYQRDRVYVRRSKRKRRSMQSKRMLQPRRFDKINKRSIFLCRKCPKCASDEIEKGSRCRRLVCDLKISGTGLKRWIHEYASWTYLCLKCNHRFTSVQYRPPARQRMRLIYGHNLQSWVLYQHIVNNQSFGAIQQNLRELFKIEINKGQLNEFKTNLFEKYSVTYRALKRQILESSVVVVDEAKMKLHDVAGYAWVFANADTVLYVFRETREGEFLHAFLSHFQGVVVSDFYSVYDSLKCPQQKCLIHLMRDLNEDVTKNPFDQDLKQMTRSFTLLLRNVVETVDKFGLKKAKLRRHRRDVKAFFRKVSSSAYSSEVAQRYRIRFLKNKDKLFTFIEFNNVPWNSNAAEHAIKHLARLRKRGMTSFTRNRIDEYMELISIFQTCEYRDLSFFQFLLSGKRELPIPG